MGSLHLRLPLLALFALSAACSRKPHVADPPPDFFADRAAHPTVLVKHGPSPQEFPEWPDAGPAAVVEYTSAQRTLRGLRVDPSSTALARDGKRPVLVYLHGGYALGPSDLDDCAPFLRAGFIVWAPAYRGENGNPGDYELGFGELDDARAAIRAVQGFPGADATRVVVFGHSAGGILSAMLALSPDLPVRDTGSAGGMYGTDLFDHVARPFADDPGERRRRVFTPNAGQLRQPHFACVGEKDAMNRAGAARAEAVTAAAHLPFTLAVVPGDHFESLAPCMGQFLARVLPKVS